MKGVLFIVAMMLGLNSMAQITYIAHRGASFLAPENTLAAAKLAWELGADAVEIDVHRSKDGRVMVCHDYTTKRVAGKNLRIKYANSDELRQLEVGSWKDQKFAGEKMPFVEEVLETLPPGKRLFIEIKCGSKILPALKKALDGSGKASQVVFIAFGWHTIINTKRTFPQNACYWLSENRKKAERRLDKLANYHLDGLDLDHQLVDAALMRRAKEAGMELLVWTVDDPQEARRLLDLGVLEITTNRPDWLKQQMR